MGQPLNLRRCHICNTINHSHEEILKCQSCRKPLVPFYYFDKQKVADYEDNKIRPDDTRNTNYGPIRGLTAIW